MSVYSRKPPVMVDLITSSSTWTKPTEFFYTRCRISAIGGGSGGGSGRKGATGTIRGGGAGGGAAGQFDVEFAWADVPASLTIVIGTAGSGGASQTTNSTDGNPGTAGTDTTVTGSFPGYSVLAARAGGAGGGGIAGAATAGICGVSQLSTRPSGGTPSATGASIGSGATSYCNVPGRAGGGVTAANVFGTTAGSRLPAQFGGCRL